MLNPQFLSSCVMTHEVTQPNQLVEITTPVVPLENVVVVVTFPDNTMKFITAENASEGPVTHTLARPGTVKIVTLLLPKVMEVSGHRVVVQFGVGAGTGEDFTGKEGAEVVFTFSQNNDPKNDFERPEGPIDVLPLGSINFPNSLNFIDARFRQAAGTTNYLTIEIPDSNAGARNPLLIEQMVELHANSATELRCVMDLQKNRKVSFEYRHSGFTMAAAIVGQVVEPGREFKFEIGDPITDASVSVSSRNP